MKKTALLLVVSLLGAAIALAGAFEALECARTVDVVAVLGGAFGAGAGVVSAVVERRKAVRRERP